MEYSKYSSMTVLLHDVILAGIQHVTCIQGIAYRSTISKTKQPKLNHFNIILRLFRYIIY